MPREIKAWACDFCGSSRVLKTKAGMVKHEKACLQNPKKKSCFSCAHQRFKPHYIGSTGDCGDDPCELGGYYCNRHLREVGDPPVVNCFTWRLDEAEGED